MFVTVRVKINGHSNLSIWDSSRSTREKKGESALNLRELFCKCCVRRQICFLHARIYARASGAVTSARPAKCVMEYSPERKRIFNVYFGSHLPRSSAEMSIWAMIYNSGRCAEMKSPTRFHRTCIFSSRKSSGLSVPLPSLFSVLIIKKGYDGKERLAASGVYKNFTRFI